MRISLNNVGQHKHKRRCMMKKALLLGLLTLASAGCTTPTVMVTGKTYPATKAEDVKIYQADKPTVPYEEIGRVSVTKWNSSAYVPFVGLATGNRSGTDVSNLLKEKAAALGGDAVIGISEDLGGFSGVVIKFTSK
jgi:hypothetical protein